ncbi:hypothetical protein MAR_033599 [Mya arenaria]|uniref:YqaJ viral recombinase domain-containing protein n=1 Tax=Mya arenaria TaxID=6604 RepID=A0ABY7G9G2_MYAAR|nr:hypothetical protein MAR_033599 [Mya arenaria]
MTQYTANLVGYAYYTKPQIVMVNMFFKRRHTKKYKNFLKERITLGNYQGRQIQPNTLKKKLVSQQFVVQGLNTLLLVISHSKTLLKKGENSATDNLVDMLIYGSNFKGNKATRYGNRQEPRTASLYLSQMTKDRDNCSRLTCGLRICKSYESLGALTDRIFKCACHGKRLVEIKCPFTLVDKSKMIESLDFITKDENGCLKLKTTGNTNYDPI